MERFREKDWGTFSFIFFYYWRWRLKARVSLIPIAFVQYRSLGSKCSVLTLRIFLFSKRLTSTARFLGDEQVHIPSSNWNAAKAHSGVVALQINPYGGLDNISPLPPNRRKHGWNGSRTVINQKLKRSRDPPLAWENEHLWTLPFKGIQ